jgi:hypothetical protein
VREFVNRARAANCLRSAMKVKEPFFLCFSLLWIAATFLPGEFRRRNGTPYEKQIMARTGFLAIGIGLLVLWYSLPQQ